MEQEKQENNIKTTHKGTDCNYSMAMREKETERNEDQDKRKFSPDNCLVLHCNSIN